MVADVTMSLCPWAQLLSPAERPVLCRQAEHKTDRQTDCSSQGQGGTSTERGTAQDGWRGGSSTVSCWLCPVFNCPQHLSQQFPILCLCEHPALPPHHLQLSHPHCAVSSGLPGNSHPTSHSVLIPQHSAEGISPEKFRPWGMQSEHHFLLQHAVNVSTYWLKWIMVLCFSFLALLKSCNNLGVSRTAGKVLTAHGN